MDTHAIARRPSIGARPPLQIAAGLLLVLSTLAGAPRAEAQKPAVNPDAQTLADFQERVKEYVELHRKLESTLPPLPKDATPQQIDTHERALAKLLQQARRDARPGDLFTPAMRELVRRLIGQVMSAPGGKGVKASILDEYTGSVRLRVNGRYPDTVPLSTVPPQVLQQLPQLPEDLEYRFVGDRLILLDPHAHVIADYIERVLP
jgi:hypothetical protein